MVHAVQQPSHPQPKSLVMVALSIHTTIPTTAVAAVSSAAVASSANSDHAHRVRMLRMSHCAMALRSIHTPIPSIAADAIMSATMVMPVIREAADHKP